MNDAQTINYVRACAELLSLPLDDARAERVAAHLARSAQLARLLEAEPLEVLDEPVAIYCPARFPDLQP